MCLASLVLRLHRDHILSELETKLLYLADEGKSPLHHTTEIVSVEVSGIEVYNLYKEPKGF